MLLEDMRDVINAFILYNHEKTIKWIDLFEEDKNLSVTQQRKR